MTAPAGGTGAPRAIVPLDRPPDTTVRVPGSKSITNRALLCAALATGSSTLEGALVADDIEAMLSCLVSLGAQIAVHQGSTHVQVGGTGGRLPAPTAFLDARLSGTTSRFILPLLALGEGPYRLDGRPPLLTRPMADGIAALRELGAEVVEEATPGHLPVTVWGRPRDQAGPCRVTVPGNVSSQFLSGLLLAGPCLPGGLQVAQSTSLVSEPYVTMTTAVMAAFGATVERQDRTGFAVAPTGYRGRRYLVEPDASAASYFFAAAAITGGRVTVTGLGSQALQGDVAFVDVLEQMGAAVERSTDSITVTGTGTLRGVDVDMSAISDTAQTLAAVAPFANGPTTVRGIGFIRAKETDRVAAVVSELRRLGIEAHEDPDGFTVRPGTPAPTEPVRTYHDHRMAMSFALIGLRVPGVTIADPGCVAKTYPGYFTDLDKLR